MEASNLTKPDERIKELMASTADFNCIDRLEVELFLLKDQNPEGFQEVLDYITDLAKADLSN